MPAKWFLLSHCITTLNSKTALSVTVKPERKFVYFRKTVIFAARKNQISQSRLRFLSLFELINQLFLRARFANEVFLQIIGDNWFREFLVQTKFKRKLFRTIPPPSTWAKPTFVMQKRSRTDCWVTVGENSLICEIHRFC